MNLRVIVWVMASMLGSSSQAATIVVSSSAGGRDDATACVLRDAIAAAVNDYPVGACLAGQGDDTIELPAGAVITLHEPHQMGNWFYAAFGLPSIRSATPSLVSIDGHGATLRRDLALPCIVDNAIDPGEFGFFEVSQGMALGLNELTLENGCSRIGAGIASRDSRLSLTRVRMIGNRARIGGAMFIEQFVGFAPQSLLIRDSEFRDNFVEYQGGAMSVYSGFDEFSDPIVKISGSAFIGNKVLATGEGGASIWYAHRGRMIIDNSTFANNIGQTRGAIVTLGGMLDLSHVTLAYNESSEGGAPGLDILNGVIRAKGLLLQANSAAGVSRNCGLNGGDFQAIGANLSSDGSCIGFSLNDTDAQLGDLGDHGGSTPSIALLPGSAAIDAATDCLDLTGVPLVVDQRGAMRPVDGDDNGQAHCDLGAYEAAGDRIFRHGFE